MYEIVTLDDSNGVVRRIFKSTSYVKALAFLERELPTRPNLDMQRDGQFVDWALEPALLST